MNFLAHLYLSGNNDKIKLGNFIADAVKGISYKQYSEEVQRGIILHRKIDTYTDKHPIIQSSKVFFQEKYNRHSGIIVDILYDHFLASNWSNYSEKSLSNFVKEAYFLLLANYLILPSEVKKTLPFMIGRNWLESYKTIQGINSIFQRMAKWTTLPDEADFAISQLEVNYDILRTHFVSFFKDIIEYVETDVSIVLHNN